MCTYVDTPVHECKLPYPLQPASPGPLHLVHPEGMGLGPFGQGIWGSRVSRVWSKGKGLGQ